MKADPQFVSEEDEEAELDQSLESLDDQESDGADHDVSDEAALAEARYLDVVGAVRALFAGETCDLDQLVGLADNERAALGYLAHVISGRGTDDRFMYAEDRLEGLNQVLAQLQPMLSLGGKHEVLRESLAEIVDDFAALRDQLTLLEDAQEEVFHDPEKKKPGEDDDDEDEGGDDEAEGDPEVEQPPAKSTVWDPDDRGDGPA